MLYYTLRYKSHAAVTIDSDEATKASLALAVCRAGLDFQEILERVSVGNHKSFYPHLFSLRVPLLIMKLGDLWAYSMGSLELLNAVVKRVARAGASRGRLVTTSGTTTRRPIKGKDGALDYSKGRVMKTRGYRSSMSYQILARLLAANARRRDGSGIATRTAERLFGGSSDGRTKGKRPSQVNVSKLGMVFLEPELDSCVAAMARLLAADAQAA